MKQYATFKLDDQLFGIDIAFVREINQLLDITPIQLSSDYVRGLINLRGQIVTILDLGIRLNIGPRQIQESSHNLILKTDDELNIIRQRAEYSDLKTCADVIGLLVDSIGDVIEVEESDIDPPPANVGAIAGEFSSGIIQLDSGLLILLHVENVLGLTAA
jgi:purine-binding chemotaxis protein CheW